MAGFTVVRGVRNGITEGFDRGKTRSRQLSLEALERRDCPAAVPVMSIAQSSDGVTLAEGGASHLLTVRLSAAATKAVQVGYQITGHGSDRAVDAADYRLTVGATGLANGSGNITFRPGETMKQVRVAVIDDTAREGNESLRFALFRPVGCTIDPVQAMVSMTVQDNDDYTASLVPLGPSRIAEGAAAAFVIELSAPATKAETFFVSTQDGTATTRDYRPLREMPVTILAGQRRSQPFALNTVADADPTETDEYFLVNARPRSTDMPAIDPMGVTIIGTGPVPIAVTVSNPSVVEGNAGFTACTFTVILSAPAIDSIVVEYATADVTATASVDYVAASGSLTFTRGQISRTVTVNVIGDTVVEENEAFQFVATVMGAGTSATATGIGSILDDDSAFQITLTYDNPNTPVTQKSVFQRAVQRLQAIIVGDLPDVSVGGRVIDDMEIKVFVETMNPLLNGYAMATAWRPGVGGLAYQGEIHINAAKIGNPGIYHTIIHEMLHALGFSSDFFSDTKTISGLGTTVPLFTGANAIREYTSVFGLGAASGVPLYEDPSAVGSYASHWSTDVFGTEIMSVGWDTTSTTLRPFSRITVGVLQDIGYRVNYNAADAYRPPTDIASLKFRSGAVPRGMAADFSNVDMLRAAASGIGSLGSPPSGNATKSRSFAALGIA